MTTINSSTQAESAAAMTSQPTGTPGSFKALCVLQILGALAGAVWVIILFSIMLNKFVSGHGRSDTTMGVFFLLSSFIVLFVLAFLGLSLWKTIKRRATFRGWVMSYALLSLASKILIFLMFLFFFSMSTRMAKADLAKENPWGMAISGEAVNNEVAAVSLQAYAFVFILLLFASALPACALLLTRTKALKQFSANLK